MFTAYFTEIKVAMNNFKHILLQKYSSTVSLKTLFSSSARVCSVNRIPVRTPFSIDINKSVLKSKWISRNTSNDITKRLQNLLPKSSSTLTNRDIHDVGIVKKRPLRKKRSEHQEKMAKNGYFTVNAFATAEEYDLEKLLIALKAQDLYEPKKFFSSDDNPEAEPDVLFATARYKVGAEPRGIYFFREGTVVMWNMSSDMESSNILAFLKNFEQV